MVNGIILHFRLVILLKLWKLEYPTFDGSSIPGMRSVESGDMVLMPDSKTAHLESFYGDLRE